MRKHTLLCSALSVMLLLGACGNTAPDKTGGDVPPADTGSQTDNTQTPADPQTPTDTTMRHIEIEVKDYGTIAVELDPSAAPITVENFVKLAGEGFYDGLTFHRIMSDFMIQGGDPQGDGTGGSSQTITGEFSLNGVENPISHTRGTISMARTAQSNDTASSQFFIMHEDNTQLDGSYAGFGHVTSGMEIVDQICKDVQPVDGDGTVPAENQPVITTIKVID